MNYYRIPQCTPAWKLLRKFAHEARKAAIDADHYAHRWGATSYVQSFAHFEGGVEYLEFDHTPDLMQWRKATHEFDPVNRCWIDEYEPNVMYRTGEQPTDGERWPTSTWCRIYGSRPKRDDEGRLPATARYIEYYGTADQYDSKGRPLPQLRRAIRAEIERMRLPVARIETLYAIVGADIPRQSPGERMTETVTPTLFKYKDDYYVSVDGAARVAGAEPVTEGRFVFLRGRASES